MSSIGWTPWLGCPSCPELFEVSEEDADATLSELLEHIKVNHADYGSIRALGLLAQARQLTADQAKSVQR